VVTVDIGDRDLWNALRERGHTLGSAHVDDDGVSWVMVDGAPTRLEAARQLLESTAAPGDRADVTADETRAERFDIEGRGPRTLG
jgi:hypothetical protein